MVRLQKQLSRKVGNTEYAKYVVVIPPKLIKGGQELKVETRNNKIIIEKTNSI